MQAADGRLLGRREVDRPDAGMGMWGAQQVAVGLTGQVHIVDIAPATGEQAWILCAGHRPIDAESIHASLPNDLFGRS